VRVESARDEPVSSPREATPVNLDIVAMDDMVDMRGAIFEVRVGRRSAGDRMMELVESFRGGRRGEQFRTRRCQEP